MLIHRYWTGPNPPESLQPILDSDLPSELIIWLDERMDWVTQRPLQHRANMVRWWLLFKHGGVWADCDITLPEILPDLPFALWDTNRFRVGVMGFPSTHPIPTYALTRLARPPAFPGPSPLISGSVLLREAIERTGTTMNRLVLT